MPKKPASRERKAKPSLTPHMVGKNAWWYEFPTHIEVYHHSEPGRIDMVKIRWTELVKAARRCGRG